MGHAMTQREWLTVGIKLIGVYFAVLGAMGLVVVGTNLLEQFLSDLQEYESGFLATRTGGMTLINVLQPTAYLLGAFALTRRTEWCLRMVKSGKDQD